MRSSEIPVDTVKNFLERYSQNYEPEELSTMLELADEAWFKAREQKLDEEEGFKLVEVEEEKSFTPDEYQGILTQAIKDELDYDLLESTQLAQDLTRRYDHNKKSLHQELQESEFEF